MISRLSHIVVIALLSAAGIAAQSIEDQKTLYYVVERGATLFSSQDSSRAYLTLKFREPVYVTGIRGRYYEVKTKDGARGLAERSVLSNVWVRVSKSRQTVYVYRGTDLVHEIPADLGYNAFADKEKRGGRLDRDHWRTPEGNFFVVQKNSRSQYYKAFLLNYPNSEDAEKGLKSGIISRDDYAAIVKAEAGFSTPPMNTPLGGMIEIHGKGTGARSNWTQGCIAVKNTAMDQLWNIIHVGTPVLVEP